jgi:hypothetical protein
VQPIHTFPSTSFDINELREFARCLFGVFGADANYSAARRTHRDRLFACRTVMEGLELLANNKVDVVISDARMMLSGCTDLKAVANAVSRGDS